MFNEKGYNPNKSSPMDVYYHPPKGRKLVNCSLISQVPVCLDIFILISDTFVLVHVPVNLIEQMKKMNC